MKIQRIYKIQVFSADPVDPFLGAYCVGWAVHRKVGDFSVLSFKGCAREKLGDKKGGKALKLAA